MDKHSLSRVHNTLSFPFELHHIKALYLNHQYKECARRCENLLTYDQDEPAHVIFLNFYAALSHEGLARTMHVYSVWRLPKIAAAESAYTRAINACSEEEHRLEESSNLSMPGLAIDQPMVQIAASKHIHVRKRNSKPSLAHLGPGLEQSHSKCSKRVERINFSWPRTFTPLSCTTVKAIQYKVCKDMDIPLDDPFTISPSEPLSAAESAQDTPIKTSNLSAKNSKDSFDSPHPPSPTPSYRSAQLPAASRAQAAYLTNLTAIRIQLTTHLHHLRDLKQSTTTEQEERARRQSGDISNTKAATKLPQSRSFWSFKDEEAEKKEKLIRIKEGRARGWNTARFDPKKYVDLAEDALAELEGV